MTPVTELTALRQRMRQRINADGGGVWVDTACSLVAVRALPREARLIDGLASLVGQPTAQAWLQTIAVAYADDVGAVRTAYERLHADAVRCGLTADEAAFGAWFFVVTTYISPDSRAAITPPATLSLAALRMRVEPTLRALVARRGSHRPGCDDKRCPTGPGTAHQPWRRRVRPQISPRPLPERAPMGMFMRRFKLKDGSESWSWIYRFTVNGEPFRGTIGKMPKGRADEQYARIRTEAREGQRPISARKVSTLLDFVPEFLSWHAGQVKSASAARYHYAWQAIAPILGRYRMSALTDALADQYILARRASGRSTTTINREMIFLHHVLRMAVRWKRLATMPLQPYEQFKELARERVLSLEEETLILERCVDPLRSMIIMALDTGFRESELVSLRRYMVNLPGGLITVMSRYTKSSETRTIEMTRRVEAIMRRVLDTVPTRDREIPILGYRRTWSVRDQFKRLVDRLGIADLRFHDLRHSFATRLLLAGVPLVHVQQMLGHKTIAMTMRYYTQTAGHLRGVIQVLDRPGHTPWMAVDPASPHAR